MNRIQRITKNLVVLYAARAATTLLKFVSFVYIARILGDETLGKFTLAIVLAAMFAIPMSLGMDDLLVRQVARDRGMVGKYLGNILPLKMVLATVMFALLLVLVAVVDYPGDTALAIVIFGVHAFISVFAGIYRATFRAFESMQWDAFLDVLENVVTASLALVLLFRGYGLVEISMAFVAGATADLILAYFLCRRKVARTRIEFDLPFWKKLLKDAVPYSVYSLFLVAAIRIDAIMVSSLRGEAVLGWYNAAYQIVLAMEPVPSLLMTALIPVISRLFVSSDRTLQFAASKAVQYLVMLGVPTAVGGTMLAGRIIALIYGPGFANSVIALQILVWVFLLACVSRPMLYTLGATNRQGTMAGIVIIGTVLNLGLNYVAISMWGYVGAAGTAVVTATVIMLAAWIVTSRHIYRLPLGRTFLRPIVAGAVMGMALYLGMRLTTAHLFLLGAVGVIIYFAVLIAIGGISADDRELLRNAIRVLHVDPAPKGERQSCGSDRNE